MWLVDTGFQGDRLTTPEQLAAASGTPARHVVRLEAVAEQVLRGPGFVDSFAEALASANAVAYKSVAAYRYGFDFDPARPTTAEVAEAAGRAGGRIEDPVLLRHLIWSAIDVGLPLQFHVGFGDTDVRLHRSNPSLLHDFLLATQETGTPIMLLHCYPFHREAGYLANVFPHVYMDLGAILNHVGARSAAVLAEALELTPFHKMLYSSDAFGLPELHYLGAIGFRRDLAAVTDEFVARGAWASADANYVSKLIGWENAARVYHLDIA
jgi:predicted TIM-barrel fold metal-dependent hydrolase